VYTRRRKCRPLRRRTISARSRAVVWLCSHSTTPTRTRTPSPTRQTRLQSYVRHTRPREVIACVGRKIVAVFGESVSVSVSVSASWNASFMRFICVFLDRPLRVDIVGNKIWCRAMELSTGGLLPRLSAVKMNCMRQT